VSLVHRLSGVAKEAGLEGPASITLVSLWARRRRLAKEEVQDILEKASSPAIVGFIIVRSIVLIGVRIAALV
jgi:hypothetical protein